MSAVHAILLVVALERLMELAIARRNTRRLLLEGAVEHGAGHYPLFILLHSTWLLAMVVAVPGDHPVLWPLIGVYGLLLLGRLWVLASLGRYWTTRIITLPTAPLVKRGPYRFVRHPNYLVVIGEIAVLPLAFGAWVLALFFSALNLALLHYRVRIEDAALAARRAA
jgi:methyltransferase